jgi:hypothetical protein
MPSDNNNRAPLQITYKGIGLATGLVFGGLIGLIIGNMVIFAGGGMVVGLAIGTAIDNRTNRSIT